MWRVENNLPQQRQHRRSGPRTPEQTEHHTIRIPEEVLPKVVL